MKKKKHEIWFIFNLFLKDEIDGECQLEKKNSNSNFKIIFYILKNATITKY